jgi:cytochrome c biogenesis protein CcdA
MLIYLLAFVGAVLTILSPCILPFLPFVLARACRRSRSRLGDWQYAKGMAPGSSMQSLAT